MRPCLRSLPVHKINYSNHKFWKQRTAGLLEISGIPIRAVSVNLRIIYFMRPELRYVSQWDMMQQMHYFLSHRWLCDALCHIQILKIKFSAPERNNKYRK